MKRETRSCARSPLMMATAKGAEYDKIQGLDLRRGLLSREALRGDGAGVLRESGAAPLRAEGSGAGAARGRGSSSVPTQHTVTVDGARVALTYKEFELLKLFLANPGIGLHEGPAASTPSGAWTSSARRAPVGHAHPHPAAEAGQLREPYRDGAQCRLPSGGPKT